MNDAGSVQVLDTTQHLIEQVGQPLVIQLHLNDLAQVGIHQLHHQVPAAATRDTLARQHEEGKVRDVFQLPDTLCFGTYTSWNSSSDFCGVNTFNRPIICMWNKQA